MLLRSFQAEHFVNPFAGLDLIPVFSVFVLADGPVEFDALSPQDFTRLASLGDHLLTRATQITLDAARRYTVFGCYRPLYVAIVDALSE